MAKETGTPADRAGKLVSGARSVTADTALRPARFFGTTPAFWMNLQAHYDLEVASDRQGRAILRAIQPFKAA